MKIKCIKCGKEKVFKNTAQIWTEGWNPINKNDYICDTCPQVITDDLDFLSEVPPTELPSIETEKSESHRQKNNKTVA